jgi:hypothetical protein
MSKTVAKKKHLTSAIGRTSRVDADDSFSCKSVNLNFNSYDVGVESAEKF